MELIYLSLLVTAIYLSGSFGHEAKDFDDSILYKIEFELPSDLNDEHFKTKYNVPTFYTHDKEKYSCAIPIAEETKEEKVPDYDGISPLELIHSMFSTVSCSYRIEAYWSYEICHGFHIKQYHEEREGKNVKFQEYYLGVWNQVKQARLSRHLAEDKAAGVKFKTVKIDNVQHPYLELDMGNGTLCDLNNEPRTTKIRYVCYPHGKNTIYSFKETSTCNYEAIILTTVLCFHPAFLPEESKEIPIKCFNSPNLARKPLSFLKQALDDLQMSDINNKIDIVGYDKHFAEDTLNVGDLHTMLEALSTGAPLFPHEKKTALATDAWAEEIELSKEKWDEVRFATGREDYKSLYDFLFGNCLIGGTGWWKYEFCFGRKVRQFHKDKKSETEVHLGYFKDSAHRDWLKSHPEKRLRRQPTDSDTTIWHHYEGGSKCDKTGRLRETDVKLMCVVSSSMSSVSMYLLEPKTCQYILVVESPLVCAMLPMVDEDGLVTESGFKRYLNVMMKKYEPDASQQKQKTAEDATSIVSDDVPSTQGTATVEHVEVVYENEEG